MSDAIEIEEEITKYLGLPVLALVPKRHEEECKEEQDTLRKKDEFSGM